MEDIKTNREREAELLGENRSSSLTQHAETSLISQYMQFECSKGLNAFIFRLEAQPRGGG